VTSEVNREPRRPSRSGRSNPMPAVAFLLLTVTLDAMGIGLADPGDDRS
jgi:hypothetical protein